jgi:hypothetical protein
VTTHLFQAAAVRLGWLTTLLTAIEARRGSRVVALQCPTCWTWVTPSRFRTPAMQCRDCHRTDATTPTRTWTREATS